MFNSYRLVQIDQMSTANGNMTLVELRVDVLRLNGEGFTLRIPHETLGREVRKMVAERLPSKPGATLVLYHRESKLILSESLQEQGISGAARLSCTYVPTTWYSGVVFPSGATKCRGGIRIGRFDALDRSKVCRVSTASSSNPSELDSWR